MEITKTQFESYIQSYVFFKIVKNGVDIYENYEMTLAEYNGKYYKL